MNKKLVVLVADLDAENAIRGLLQRHQSLDIAPLTTADYDLHRHPERDPGCRCNAEAFLRGFYQTHDHSIVVFDRHGCGLDGLTAAEIELRVEERLSSSGWTDRCCVIVLDPELEIWVWSDSPQVDRQLGWAGRTPSLRQWLEDNRFITVQLPKPNDPKKVMLDAMRLVRKPLSPKVFYHLASNIGLGRCQDRAFLKLKQRLQTWFPRGNEP